MTSTNELHLVMIRNSDPERFQLVTRLTDDEGSMTAYGPMNEREARALMFAAGIDASVVDASIREARLRATQGDRVSMRKRDEKTSPSAIER